MKPWTRYVFTFTRCETFSSQKVGLGTARLVLQKHRNQMSCGVTYWHLHNDQELCFILHFHNYFAGPLFVDFLQLLVLCKATQDGTQICMMLRSDYSLGH